MMADCLERADGQGISREEFFVVHNKSGGLIGSSSLCIGSLGGASVIAKKCQDSLDALTDHDKIAKKQLNKSDDVITSGFILLNQEHSKSGAFKLSSNPVKSPTTDEKDGSELSCSPVTPTSHSHPENLQLPINPSINLKCTNKEGNLNLQNTKPVKFDDDLNVFGSEQLQQVVILLSDDSNSSVELNASGRTLKRNDLPLPTNKDAVPVTSHVEAKKVMATPSSEVGHSISIESVTPSFESIKSDKTESNSKNNVLRKESQEEELPETSCDSSKTNDIEDVELCDVEESSARVSESDLSEIKSEVINVKPDILDMSMFEDDEDEVFPPDLETANDTQPLPESISEDHWNEDASENQITVSHFIAKDDSNEGKNSDDVQIETNVKSKTPDVVSEGGSLNVPEVEETPCKKTSESSSENKACDKPENKDSEKSLPASLLRNSRCTIQLVPKGHGKLLGNRKRVLVESDEDWQQDSETGLAERLETLTGTVKIGCLSVTPLLPVSNREKDKNQTKVGSDFKASFSKIPVTQDPTKNRRPVSQDSSAPNENVSVFVKDNTLLKNHADITVSPKSCESGVDALETLKVKIPQLIESFTGGARSGKMPSYSRQDPDKNLIVNKNLKIIESFLMQKGYRKEATILKDKTDIIKPYLEDIALRMEKNINERRMGPLLEEPSELSRTVLESFRPSESQNSDKTVENELSALTEKFLNSSAVRSRHSRRPEEHSFGHLAPPDKIRMYDRYYGKSYYDGLDYLVNRDGGNCGPRGIEACMNKVYRSSRHDREDYMPTPPDMSMYDQFLPEFDNKVHPTSQIGKSNCFSHSDFSQFIDEFTADKYNNFIHFMVGDTEAQSYDVVESKMWKESEIQYLGGSCSPTVNCCFPTTPPASHLYPPGPCSYSQAPFPMGPVSPAIGRPLPMDNARESCGQLTITPLDESGKPYGPVPTPPEACSRGLCGEPYQSFTRGMLPPVPPLLPNDTLSQQLTITPLQQTSNLPYLHRSAESALRRRGRPPMDPEYAAVGYRKDAYANVRFSRSDFMARVESNIEPPCPDSRYLRTPRIPSDPVGVEGGLQSEHNKVGPSLVRSKESKPSTAPLLGQGTPKIQSAVLPSGNRPEIPTPTVTKSRETPVKLPVTSPPSEKPTLPVVPSVSSGQAILLPNGYKRVDQKLEKPKPKFVDIAPKPTSPSEPVVSKTKTQFQVMSKQVKINPEKLLSSSSIKISLVEKKPVSESYSSNAPSVSIRKTNFKENQVSSGQKLTTSSLPADNITKLQSVFKNTTITLKPAQGTLPPSVKDPLPNPENPKTLTVEEPQVTVTPQIVNKADKCTVNEASKVEEVSTKPVSSPLALSKPIQDENQSDNASLTQSSHQDETLNQTLAIVTTTKVKKKRRIPHFKKKKKKVIAKSSVEHENKIVKTHKVVVEKPLSVENKKPDIPLSSPPKTSPPKISSQKVLKKTDIIISSAVTHTSESDSSKIDPCEMGEQSADGVRRSGRKRKIIEGNPKFRDMERVDLKYFREERLKTTPAKRKAEPKAIVKQESTNKKRSTIEKKTTPTKELIHSSKQCKVISTNSKYVDNVEKPKLKQEEDKSNEKLQQFLDVNDIYLKPQTFI